MRRFAIYAAILATLVALIVAGTAGFPWNIVPPL
jgi:hypothetical protein